MYLATQHWAGEAIAYNRPERPSQVNLQSRFHTGCTSLLQKGINCNKHGSKTLPQSCSWSKNHTDSENTVRISNYHTSYGNLTPSLSASQQKFDQLCIQKSVVLNTWDNWKILSKKYSCNCKKPWRQRRRNSYSSTLPLTSAIDGGGKLKSLSGRFIPRGWYGTHIIGDWWARRPVWTGVGSLVPIVNRSPSTQPVASHYSHVLHNDVSVNDGQHVPVCLNRRAAGRYRVLASIMPSRKRFSWNWY